VPTAKSYSETKKKQPEATIQESGPKTSPRTGLYYINP